MRLFMAGIVALGLIACDDHVLVPDDPNGFSVVIPQGFPDIPYPSDNAYTPERWALGRKLFYDKALSRDSTVSCASCHRPEFAFADYHAVSPGVDGRLGNRNVPSLANVAYHPYYLREGGLPTLEMQVFVPLQETHEMDFEIALAAARLAQDSAYRAMSESAYDRPMDPYVITRALAAFERTLISGDSRYDRYLAGTATTVISPAEKAGMDLFFSERTNCSACHGGYNFTTYAFANNGLYAEYADPGRFRLTNLESDRALFKIPSLRNVSITAPYMHDGSVATLREVIDHYDSGGQAHPNKSTLIRPLHLTESEKDDLVAFLQMLIDPTFIHNPHLRPE